MAEEHHHVHHKKFDPVKATEGMGVVIIALLGLAMLIGLLTASGNRVPW